MFNLVIFRLQFTLCLVNRFFYQESYCLQISLSVLNFSLIRLCHVIVIFSLLCKKIKKKQNQKNIKVWSLILQNSWHDLFSNLPS